MKRPPRCGMSHGRVVVVMLLTAIVGGGCAEGVERQPDVSVQPDTIAEIVMPADTETADTIPDTSTLPDTTEPDTASTFCTPSMTLCSDANTLSTCRADGAAIDTTTCPHGCADGACSAPPVICVANTTTCQGYDTLERCSADGTSKTDESCAPGRCLDGACTTGNPTAAACTADSDCLGGTCYCKAGECGSSALSGGYCTTRGCDTLGCAVGELCIYADAEAPICVKDCTDCTQQGLSCAYRPADDGGTRTWAESCFTGNQTGIGKPCVTDAECVGGLCLHTSPDGVTISGGYCSAPCDAQAACPDNAACVGVSGYLSDGGFCALKCVDGGGSGMVCPPERPSTLVIDCFGRAPIDGGFAISVCFQR